MKHSFFARCSFAIIVVVVFLLPFIWIGTRKALETNRNDVKDWLPADFPETKTHRWFQQHFPHEQFVLASWEGCNLDDPRLELLAKKLVPPEESRPSGQPWFFKSVLTGRRLVDDLKARDPNLSEEEVLERLEGSLIGKDHYKTCLVVTLSEEAEGRNLRRALEKIRELAWECKIEPQKKEASGNVLARAFGRVVLVAREMIFGRNASHEGIYLGGPPVDNVAIDVEGECTLYRLAGLSAIVGLGISWLCFRSVRLTFMVFFIALLAAGIGLASVFFTGSTVDAILLSMPSLVYVLAMSGAVHIINYYHDAVREHGLERAPERALRHGMIPCALAAITTALGLGSLVASHLVPINKFGIYSAWGVLASLGLLFLYLPASLHYLPSREYVKGGAKNPDGQQARPALARFWHAVGRFITAHNRLVAVGCLLIMAFFIVGLTRVDTSVKLMKLFSDDAEIIHDYGVLEEQIGPLVPMEIVLHVDNQKCKLSTVDRMRLAQKIELAIERQRRGEDGRPETPQQREKREAVGGALSAATFAPDIKPDDRRAGLERILGINRRRTFDRVLSAKIEEHRRQFRDYLAVDKDVAVLDHQTDPTLEQLGIPGAVAQLLKEEANLHTMGAVRRFGAEKDIEKVLASGKLRKLRESDGESEKKGFQSVDNRYYRTLVEGIDPKQAARDVLQAVDGWETAHRNPTLEELQIEPEIAEVLQARELTDLLTVERHVRENGKRNKSATANLADTVAGIGPQEAAHVMEAIDRWRTDHGQELWRISVRVKALGDVDYGLFVEDLRHKVEPVLAAYREHGAEGISATYTGLVPLVYKAQRELLGGLYNSLKWAFALIALVMIFVLRSPSAGLLSMIPNVFPVVLIFGAMGWLGILVDVGTMMTASVALGVAVDDTVHFLTWFRRGLDEGRDRKGAVMLAYERCGTAMSQTTLIGGLGLSVFAFSTFTPTQRFGLLMLTLLAAALAGDLIFLPALLSGPAGRVFRASKKKRPEKPLPEEGAPADGDEEVVAVPMAAPPPKRHVRREPPHRSTRAS